MLMAATCPLQSPAFRNFKYLFPFYELITEVKGTWWIKVLAQGPELLNLETETRTTYTLLSPVIRLWLP